jgi:hypothetical protein
MESGEMSYKKTSVAEDIWGQTAQRSLTCPQCKGFLCVVQAEPIYGTDNDYTPYRTIVECSSCSFRMVTESFTILGGVKDFDNEYVEIGSWGPSGSRILSRFKHSISSNLLNELKESQELVEFLVVNERVVQVIG